MEYDAIVASLSSRLESNNNYVIFRYLKEARELYFREIIGVIEETGEGKKV